MLFSVYAFLCSLDKKKNAKKWILLIAYLNWLNFYFKIFALCEWNIILKFGCVSKQDCFLIEEESNAIFFISKSQDILCIDFLKDTIQFTFFQGSNVCFVFFQCNICLDFHFKQTTGKQIGLFLTEVMHFSYSNELNT